MGVFPILSGYSSLREARTRAEDNWARSDALGKLIGLLIEGKVRAFNKDYTEYPPGTWSNPKNYYLLRPQDEKRIGSDPDPSTVFLTEDLDKCIPTFFQQQAERDQSRPKPSAPNPSEAIKGARRRGRPPNPNLDDFWIEAALKFKKGEQGATGQTQKQFIHAMVAWCEKNMSPAERYTDETVGDKIERFWRRLDLGK